jgi:hypothetical protein
VRSLVLPDRLLQKGSHDIGFFDFKRERFCRLVVACLNGDLELALA